MIDPMRFVLPAPPVGSGGTATSRDFLTGMQAIHQKGQDDVRNSLAERNAAVQEGYLSRNLAADQREVDSARKAEVESLIAEFREASRRGDKVAVRAARDKLERNGIDVEDVTSGQSPELAPPSLSLPGVDNSVEGMLIEDDPGSLEKVDSLEGGSVAPPSFQLPRGQRLIDKSTGKELGSVDSAADTGVAPGNVEQVFKPLIVNARSPEHAKAAETAMKSAQELARLFGEAKAIEYGKAIYEREAGGIDKITAGRGIGGTAGAAGTMSGFGKTDFQQTDTGDDFAHKAAQDALGKVAGGAKSMGMLRDFTSTLQLLQSTEGMSQQQAKATLMRAQSGLTVNKAELERMEGGAGLMERIGNAIKMVDDGTLTQDYIRELTNAVSTMRDGLVAQLRTAGETARNSVMAAAQFADPVERAGRAAYAYRTVTGDFGPYAADAAAWDKTRPQVQKTKGGVVAKKGGGGEAKQDRLSRLRGMVGKK